MALSERNSTLLLTVVLVGIGVFAWTLHLRPTLVVDASELAELPLEIGPWSGRDIEMDRSVADVLDADLNIQRAYFGPGGSHVWLYIGYYGTARGGRPEHTPRGCYTGAGWGIVSSRILESDRNSQLQVQEYQVERAGEMRLVHFWYRSHRRGGMTGGLDQNLDRIFGRLADGRADGALVRVSTVVTGDDVAGARSKLLALGSTLDPLLAERWPEESLAVGQS